jgi:hypothetical protein
MSVQGVVVDTRQLAMPALVVVIPPAIQAAAVAHSLGNGSSRLRSGLTAELDVDVAQGSYVPLEICKLDGWAGQLAVSNCTKFPLSIFMGVAAFNLPPLRTFPPLSSSKTFDVRELGVNPAQPVPNV